MSLGEAGLSASAFAMLFSGGLVGIAFRPSEKRLGRGPYFACFGLLSFFSSLAFFPIIFMIDAILGRFVGPLLLLIGAWLFVAGIGFGRTSAARARDIGWSRWAGLLTYVPIISLVLILTKSSEQNRPDQHLLAGTPGALIGFVLFVMSYTAIPYFETLAADRDARVVLGPAEEAAYVEFQVGAFGIEGLLQIMADEAVLPIAIGESTTLAQIGASGTLLTRVYRVRKEESGLEMDDFWAHDIKLFICEDPFFATLLKAGAVIRESYVYEGGLPIGSVKVSKQSCSDLV